MRSYVVRQGDHLAKIAAQFGVSTAAIWEMPQNREIKEKRDPNLLAPGDVVRIPVRPEAGKRYSANRDNSYRVGISTIPLNVTFSKFGELLKDLDFEVYGLGHVEIGRTDSQGRATILVRADLNSVEVRFTANKISFELRIGCLDPVETELGVAQRLAQLRYIYIPRGATGPQLRERVRRAVGRFQRDEGLPENGQVDLVTRDQLKSRSGG